MIETEVKIKLNKEEKNRLEDRIGKRSRFFNQKNLLYQIENGYLRLREEKGKRIITYKGLGLDSQFNSREEIEFLTPFPFRYLKIFFERIGFKEDFYYEKKRAEFDLNNCTLALDILPNNQTYLEIEGEKKDILRNLEFLGLDIKNSEKRSYLEILKGGEK
jgi:predicted adenylyl cyclase CyaB